MVGGWKKQLGVVGHTVDGRNPANQLIGPIVYAIIYKVLYIPGGAGFLSSTEGADFIVESQKCAVCVHPKIFVYSDMQAMKVGCRRFFYMSNIPLD